MTKTKLRRTELSTLHFNLGERHEEEQLTFHIALRDYALRPMNAKLLRSHIRNNPLLDMIPVTHYLEDVPLPADAIAMAYVTKPVTVNGNPAEEIVSMALHIPTAGRRRYLKSEPVVPGEVHHKLLRYGITAADIRKFSNRADYMVDLDRLQDPFDTAASLLLQHPHMINLSTKDGGVIPAFIKEHIVAKVLKQMPGLVDEIWDLRDAGIPWSKTVEVRDLDGKVVMDDDPRNPKPLMTSELHRNVLSALVNPLKECLKRSQQEEKLKGEQWTLQYGVASSTYNAKPSVKSKTVLSDTTGLGKRRVTGVTNWTVRNIASNNGLEVASAVTFTPPGTQNLWKAQGVWTGKDTVDPLIDQVVTDLMAGKLSVKINTSAAAQGLIKGELKLDGAVEENRPVQFKASLTKVDPKSGTKAKGSGKFTLNVTRTGLTYDLEATDLDGSNAVATFHRESATGGVDYRPIPLGNETGMGHLSVTCKNHWLRHLGAFVEFLDTGGTAFNPDDWNSRMPGFLQKTFEPSPTKKWVGLVPPVQAVFGIPIPADPTTFTIPIPKRDVNTVRIYWGGLGRGHYDGSVCAPGIVFTSVVELAVPTILMIAGAVGGDSPKFIQDLLKDEELLFAVLAVCAFLVTGASAAAIGTAQNPAKVAKDIAVILGPMIAKPALGALAKYIIRKIAEGSAARFIPFVNIGMQVLSVAVATAQIAQTIDAVLQSPFYYQTDIVRTITLLVTLRPDEKFKEFPSYRHSLRVSVVYDRGTTNPVWEGVLDTKFNPGVPLTVGFQNVPAGGNLRAFAFFYADNGWQSAQGETSWVAAEGSATSATLEIGMEVKNNVPDLSGKSVYTHEKVLVYRENKPIWEYTKDAPTATRSTPSRYPGKDIVRHVGITLAQSPAMLGYAWQATGLNVPRDFPHNPKTNDALFTLQNRSTVDPQKGYAIPKVGFSSFTGPLYDLASPDDGSGLNFFIDTTGGDFDGEKNVKGGCHIRRVRLQHNGPPPDFSTATGKSWGRFETPMERYVLHPEGYVLGIDYSRSKVFKVALSKEFRDEEAPVATMMSGEGERHGLIKGPEGIAVALDGRLLVLEGGNNRIQAFDIEGNPVPYFAVPGKPNEKSPLLPLITAKEGCTYLDLAVESKGYLYVLAYTGDGISPSDYRMDIYKPDGTFLVTTTGMAAAKMTVDFLRAVYTMNYEVILGAEGRTEPSISKWLPPPPAK
jgi:hypothetical protein